MSEETIFATALEKKTAAERQAYLSEACAGNPAVRSAVEELLKASADAGSFLAHPPKGLEATIATDASSRDTVNSSEWTVELPFLLPCDKPGRIGKLVGSAGEYEIIEVVGRGGMGAVLRAFETKLSRVVAVKVMAPELAANATAVKRFLREATTAAAVHHEHVVTIHAVDESHRPPFLVMQFIAGQTLQQKIDREGALELKHILRIGSQMAAGLTAAHKQGLIHRDVKPSNILLENGVERVKISDFGLARAADDMEMTKTGIIAGTPQYMSPEQATGDPFDARSDLFSLGSVLYTMCTGRPAFRAETTMGVLRRVCDDAPRPIREVNPEIPEWLAAIVNKLLEKDPADRFQSASEVSDLLSQNLAHVQNPARAPLPAMVAPSKPRSDARHSVQWRSEELRKRVLWLGAALVMMIVTIGIVLFVQTRWIDYMRGGAAAIAKADNQRLQGNWVALNGEINGEPLNQDQLSQLKATFTDNRMQFWLPDGSTVDGLIYLGCDWIPKRISVAHREEPRRVSGMQGIYELTGDQLRICMGGFDEQVTEFKSRRGSRILLAEFARPTVQPSTIILPALPDHGATSGNNPKSIYEMEIPGLSKFGPSTALPVEATNWGKFIHAEGDGCSILRHRDANSNHITITVPGTRPFNLMHGFNLDAPRLLEEVAGDFVIEVKLPPWQRPLSGTSSRGPEGNSYLGAGLLVWIDEQNLLRWERSAWGEQNGGAPFFHAEWCSAGERTSRPDVPTNQPDTVTHLQIERRGGELALRASVDGQTWQSRHIVKNLKLPTRLSVGIFAQNVTNKEFSPVFERLAVAGAVTRPPSTASP